jgi:hypothetical protein
MTTGRQANTPGDTPLERASGSSGGSLNSEFFALSPKDFSQELKAMSSESAAMSSLELLDAGNPLTIEGAEPARQKADSGSTKGDQLPQFVQAKQIFENIDITPEPQASQEENSVKMSPDAILRPAQNAFLDNWFGFDAKTASPVAQSVQTDANSQEQSDRQKT